MDEKECYFFHFQSQPLRAINGWKQLHMVDIASDFNPRNYALLNFLSVKHTLHYLAPHTT